MSRQVNCNWYIWPPIFISVPASSMLSLTGYYKVGGSLNMGQFIWGQIEAHWLGGGGVIFVGTESLSVTMVDAHLRYIFV